MNTGFKKKCYWELYLYKFLFLISSLGIPYLSLAEESAAKEPPKKLVFSSEPIGGDVILQLVLSMVLVIGVIVLFAWLMRRVGGANWQAGSSLKVLGGVSVGAREKVVLVKVGETQLVLGVAPGQVRKLHVLDVPVQQENNGLEEKDETIGFSERLKMALGRRS
jgi:flagellar protein FliO/FliZ